MHSILVQVNPKSVKHDDLPIDPTNAAEIKKQAVAWGGIHTPIEIWIPDPDQRIAIMECPELLSSAHTILVMDGFHRTSVAEALGYDSIPALLYDCTEDEFWDKRISQARKHHSVEDDRLHAWIVASWRQTQFPHETGQSFVNTIKSIENYLAGTKHAHPPKGGKALLEWFRRKAELWGREASEICKVILEKEHIYDPRLPVVRSISLEQGLTADQTKRLTDAGQKKSRLTRKIPKENLREYAVEVVLPGKDIPYREWRDSIQKPYQPPVETEEMRRKKRIADGVEKIRALATIEHRIDELATIDFFEVLNEFPHLAEKLNRFLGKVKTVSEKANIDLAVGIEESELIALRQRVVSLERQLKERPVTPVIVPESVIAQSSVMYS